MKFFLLLAAAFPLLAATPAWDSSGNGLLNGAYNFRQVQYTSDGSGNILSEIAYSGAINFSGTGTYTLSGSNTLTSTAGPVGIPSSGTYSVAASGYGFLSDPVVAGASVYFLVANHILLGSATENPGANGSYNNDLFIASLATPTFTNSSFNGAYTISGFIPGADVTYQLTPDGAGHLGAVNKTGYDETGTYTESVRSATYTFSSGVCLMTIGVNVVGNGVPVSYGQESLYMSPDTTFVFGGSPNGFDFFVGVRNPTGSTSLTNSLYYEIGLDEDASQYASDQTANIDTYYGVFNAFLEANGYTGASTSTVLGHERLIYAGSSAESVTYTAQYPIGSTTFPADVGQLDPSATVQYTIGAGGVRIGLGIGPWLGIEVAIPATAPTPSGAVFIDPTGMVNTASSAPFTAGISPGEFVTLYNTTPTSTSTQCWTAGPPFPTTLAGVQVLIDNIAAPIYCTSPQITFIVPYEVSASPIASIQVTNNGANSNIATAYVYKATPGVFTVPTGGIGYAAAQHGNYSLITTSNPAQPGEEIVVYLSGLGSVFPVNGVSAVDGAATGPNGATVVANFAVDVAGFGSTSIPYAGLTPGTAGLYQINFVVPASAPAGNDALAIVGPNSYSSQALLPVGGSASATSNSRKVLPRLSIPAVPGGTIRP